MAVRKEAVIHNYIGSSTEAKPTGVPAGSMFHEWNTRCDYITYDGTNWVVFLSDVKQLFVTKTLVKGAEPINVNLFSFTGPFRFRRLWGCCITATDSSDIDDAYFNIYDGTNTVDLSDGTPDGAGVTLTGITVGSVIGITDLPGVVLTYEKSNQCRYLPAGKQLDEVWQRGLVTAKNGVTNYVRFTYDSAAASTLNLVMEFQIEYVDVCALLPSVMAAA